MPECERVVEQHDDYWFRQLKFHPAPPGAVVAERHLRVVGRPS